MSKVEEVARAIRHAHSNTPHDCVMFEDSKWIGLARAAILAMREPTEGMIDAGSHVEDGSGDFWIGTDAAKAWWNAMLTAALSDGEEG